MIRYKQAIRFPDIESVNQDWNVQVLHTFSEDTLHTMSNTLRETYNSFGNLLNYIVQCNQTHELHKQISVKERALEQIVDVKRKQLDFALAEEAKRWEIWKKQKEQQLVLEIEQLHLEAHRTFSEFTAKYEMMIKGNAVLKKIVENELENIQAIKSFVDPLSEVYGRRREYIQHCDFLRRSYKYLNQYMRQLV